MIKKLTVLFLAVSIFLGPAQAVDGSKENDTLENCGTVLKEIFDVPDDIPQSLIDKAECVIVIPSTLKFAFVFGGSYGRGAMSCRSGEKFDGPWSAPAMMALEGASVGFQLGGHATDFVILVMNPRGASSILSSKVKVGADASAAAGPKGRTAEAATDVTLRAEILTYSRSRGLFAGISLAGSTLRPDNDASAKVYARKITAKEIVLEGSASVTSPGQKMVGELNKRSPKNLSS